MNDTLNVCEYAFQSFSPAVQTAKSVFLMQSIVACSQSSDRATFEMRELLREAGLEISNENNQYADHIGIELLYASVLCTRFAEADGDTVAQAELATKLSSFVQEHPLSWIDKLISAVEASKPNGYFAAILSLGKALLSAVLTDLV